MRIHTSATEADLETAADLAGVNFVRVAEHGSRTRERAFEVILSGSSSQTIQGGGRKAATWDEWGVFLAYLYGIDPDLCCWAYNSVHGFNTLTGGRFVNGWPNDAHGDHSWEWRAGGGYCRRCSARLVRA